MSVAAEAERIVRHWYDQTARPLGLSPGDVGIRLEAPNRYDVQLSTILQPLIDFFSQRTVVMQAGQPTRQEPLRVSMLRKYGRSHGHRVTVSLFSREFVDTITVTTNSCPLDERCSTLVSVPKHVYPITTLVFVDPGLDGFNRLGGEVRVYENRTTLLPDKETPVAYNVPAKSWIDMYTDVLGSDGSANSAISGVDGANDDDDDVFAIQHLIGALTNDSRLMVDTTADDDYRGFETHDTIIPDSTAGPHTYTA